MWIALLFNFITALHRNLCYSSTDSDPLGIVAATKMETSYKPEEDKNDEPLSESDSSYTYMSDDEEDEEG